MFPPILSFGPDPFQEWIVTQYAKIEQQRLGFLRREQRRLRADTYQAVQQQAAALPSGTCPRDFGRRVVLPSSFIGGPRHMNQLYHAQAHSLLPSCLCSYMRFEPQVMYHPKFERLGNCWVLNNH